MTWIYSTEYIIFIVVMNTIYRSAGIMLLLYSSFFLSRCKPPAETPAHYPMESATDRETAFQQFPGALYPIRKGNQWGYINRKGEIVLESKWDDVGEFYEGKAKAAISNAEGVRYGYIDPKGQWVIEPVYQSADDFSEGMAMVKRNGLCGYVDANGKEIIACQFEDAGPFSEGFAAVKQGGWTGFINTAGTMVVQPAYTVSVGHTRFRQGMAPVFGADEQTGFVDSTGQWAISAQFHSAGNFVKGLAWAMWQQDDSSAEHGYTIKGGYIDTAGVYVIPPEYDFGWDFSEDLATVWVRSEDKTTKIWKVIDPEGNVVLDSLLFRNVGALHDGLIPIQDEDMKWGFMDRTGKVIIAPQYAGINHFRDGLARMEVGTAFANTIVYINPKGEIVWKE